MSSREPTFESEISVAESALVRLLVKLGLLQHDQQRSPYVSSDFSAIAYFGGMGCYKEADALEKVSAALGVPFQPLTTDLKKQLLIQLDQEPYSRLPAIEWLRLRALPIECNAETISVALSNPLDMDAIRKIEFLFQRKIRVVLASEREMQEILYAKEKGKNSLDFTSLLESSQPLVLKNPSLTAKTTTESIATKDDIAAPIVVRLVNKIFATTIQNGASDIHISSENTALTVRIRVDGIMRHFLDIPENLKGAVISRIKVLCGMDIAEKRLPQDGRIRLKTNLGERDLRISTVPTAYGEDLVARILVSDLGSVSFESLGIPAALRTRIERALTGSSKVILSAGPTGSGKTSTLYASVKYLHDGTRQIITIEDPIEYRISGISQIQVNPRIEMTFARALRSVLRQDPDVILVGEIRDSETAQVSMQVAQTGHLVFASIHTNSAPGTIIRLRDLGIPSYMIASSLGAILAQRLVRRLCRNCCQPVTENDTKRALALGLDSTGYKSSKGCDECEHTGFRGRVGIFSFLEITPAISNLVREDASEWQIEDAARKNGYQSLEESALGLAAEGVTSLSEIERCLGPLDFRVEAKSTPEVIVSTEPIPDVVFSKRKVLFIDDDDNVRALFGHLLKYEMFDVSFAENGVEALEKLYQDRPDLVICDVMMPKMDGFAFLERVRADTRTKGIPILMFTAAANEEMELQMIKGGANDYIGKTVRPEILIARINRLLNQQ